MSHHGPQGASGPQKEILTTSPSPQNINVGESLLAYPQRGRTAGKDCTIDGEGPSTEPSIQWTTLLDNEFVGSGLVMDEQRLYIQVVDFWAINKIDGSVAWKRTEDDTETSAPTVDVDKNVVYLYSGADDALVALNTSDGSVVWSNGSSPQPRRDRMMTLSTDGFLYYATVNDNLVKVSADDGSTEWTASLNIAMTGVNNVIAVPDSAVDDGVFLGGGDRDAWAFEQSNGNQRWMYNEAGTGEMGDAAFQDGSFWLGADEDNNNNDVMYRFPPDSNVPDWQQNGFESMEGVPLVTSDHVIGHNLDFGPVIVAFNKNDGSVAWDTSTSNTGGFHEIIADTTDRIYTVTEAFDFSALDRTDGSVIWTASVPSDQGVEIHSWLVDDGPVYVYVGSAFGSDPADRAALYRLE